MSNRQRPLILLAEDEGDVSLVTKTRLEANGFDVAVAADGEEALARLRELKPDLVLLDLKMPKLDGYQVCRSIKESPETRAIPVILFSASSSHSLALRDKCLELGADDHVRKPYVPEELLAKIRRLLGAGHDPDAGHNRRRDITELSDNSDCVPSRRPGTGVEPDAPGVARQA
jgi:two-component system phosphate regulon response regulator PhoB